MKDCFHVMQKALAKWTMDWNLGSKRTQRLPVGCGRSVRRRSGFVGAACQIGRCHRQRQLRAWHPKLSTGRGGSVAWPPARALFRPGLPRRTLSGTRTEWKDAWRPARRAAGTWRCQKGPWGNSALPCHPGSARAESEGARVRAAPERPPACHVSTPGTAVGEIRWRF